MTEEQHRENEANRTIDELTGDVNNLDHEIDFLLNEQKEIQSQSNILRQMAA